MFGTERTRVSAVVMSWIPTQDSGNYRLDHLIFLQNQTFFALESSQSFRSTGHITRNKHIDLISCP